MSLPTWTRHPNMCLFSPAVPAGRPITLKQRAGQRVGQSRTQPERPAGRARLATAVRPGDPHDDRGLRHHTPPPSCGSEPAPPRAATPSAKWGVHINAIYAIYRLMHILHIKLHIFTAYFLHIRLIQSIYCAYLLHIFGI